MEKDEFTTLSIWWKNEPLSQEEILEGNKLMLRFEEYDTKKSDKWIVECAKYDQSWDELMRVAEKITLIWSESVSEKFSQIKHLRFNLKHLVLHEIIGRKEFLYRKCVGFLKEYFRVLSQISEKNN